MNKKLIWGIVIVIVVVAGALYVLCFKPSYDGKNGNFLKKDSDAAVADWKTYKDNKFGFEIRYPSNIVIKTENNKVMFDLGNSMEKTYSKIENEKVNVNRGLVIEAGLVSPEKCYKVNSAGEKFADTDNDYSPFITDSGIELGPQYISSKNTSTLSVDRYPFSTINNGICYQFIVTSKYPLNTDGSSPFSNGVGGGTSDLSNSILSTFKFTN